MRAEGQVPRLSSDRSPSQTTGTGEAVGTGQGQNTRQGVEGVGPGPYLECYKGHYHTLCY